MQQLKQLTATPAMPSRARMHAAHITNTIAKAWVGSYG